MRSIQLEKAWSWQLVEEGVAIVLMDSALRSWRAGGEQWKAWSSRLITARLEVALSSGRGGSTFLSVLSCSAPTYAAEREEKDKFYDDLQQALNEIPPNEPYIILGDMKRDIHKHTWKHPKTKRWHCIEYATRSKGTEEMRRCINDERS